MDKRKQVGYDPKGIGERSEAQILARMLKDGVVVLSPFGDNQRYDLVVDEGGEFIRVQCKTGCVSEDGGSFVFPICSNNWNTKTRRGYKGEVEVFAVYLREEDDVFIVNASNIQSSRTCSIRLSETKNGQKRGVRMAEYHRYKSGMSLLDYP